jgi:hypothetical protein
MNTPVKAPSAADIMEAVLLKGDLARLTPAERITYYNAVCKSIGLNPLTQPLAYMSLQGKLQLYAKRDAADQLRRLRNVSIEIVSQGLNEDLYSVHVQATDATGRKDEDLGVVPLPASTKGEFRANLILKAVTKAKRRVTLSTLPAPTAKELAGEMHEEIPFQTEHAGDVVPKQQETGPASAAATPSPSTSAAAATIHDKAKTSPNIAMAIEAAMRGKHALKTYYSKRSQKDKDELAPLEAELMALYPNDFGSNQRE